MSGITQEGCRVHPVNSNCIHLAFSFSLTLISTQGYSYRRCVYLWCVHRAKDAAEIMIKESGAGEVH